MIIGGWLSLSEGNSNSNNNSLQRLFDIQSDIIVDQTIVLELHSSSSPRKQIIDGDCANDRR